MLSYFPNSAIYLNLAILLIFLLSDFTKISKDVSFSL